jgi:hypothetical protein
MAKPTLAQIQACASKAEVDALILNQADPTNVGCSNITRCTRCANCQSCTDCDDSTGCSNCVNCDNCTVRVWRDNIRALDGLVGALWISLQNPNDAGRDRNRNVRCLANVGE